METKKVSNWTKWQSLVGVDNEIYAFYRSNGRKTQIKLVGDNVRGEACKNKMDEFDLYFGVKMAYLRARNKALIKKKAEYESVIKQINNEISDNESIIKSMMNSLEA